MATYTTAALVKKTIENIDASLLDADIEAFIDEAEGILDAVMETSFVATFDAAKHKILRSGANKWAALTCLGFNTEGFVTTSDAFQTADLLWDQWQSILELLERESTVRYLESL